MMRSLYSGVSGLKTHQAKMDVISNNIANINTIGFKRGSMSFKESISQTLSSSSAANDETGRGGQSGSQVGLGVNVGSVATIMTQGAAQRTDNGNDLMINGEGFFVVKDATGFFYTRAGSFEVDAEGNMVDSNGYKLCGWQVEDDPNNPGRQKIIKDVVTPLNIYEGNKSYAPASPTTSMKVDGNLNPSTTKEQLLNFSFYDSMGNKYTANGKLNYDETDKKWTFTMNEDVEINGERKVQMDFGLNGKAVQLEFENGTLKGGTTGSVSFKPTFKQATPNPYNSELSQLTIDFSAMTEFNSTVTVSTTTLDGNTAGKMTGYTIDGNGIINASYSNGETRILGQIPLADFDNPAALESRGGNLFAATSNSGEFNLIGLDPGSIGSSLITGCLEMSNVDISFEFSEMIVIQRGFQASSRIISVGDEMVQELVNLKR